MSPKDFPHSRLLLLLMVTLFAGPIGCDRAVTRLEMTTAQDEVDKATVYLAKMEQQLKDTQKEFKDLQSFGGPDHQSKLKAAVALRAEKDQLDVMKKDLDNRLQTFEKDTARFRETLVKMKQQNKQP